jgi:hypothetical protein
MNPPQDGQARPALRLRRHFPEASPYWDPIEAGVGSISQSYLTLTEADRRSVREEVRARLSQFESNGTLLMSLEMLIGRGRA